MNSVAMHTFTTILGQRPWVNVESSLWIETGYLPEATGESAPVTAQVADRALMIFGRAMILVQPDEIDITVTSDYFRNTMPIRDQADNLGVQPPVSACSDEIVEARAMPRRKDDHLLHVKQPTLNTAMPQPSFLGIGAQRCSTTTLHMYLRFHPTVFVPAEKELHWFDGRTNYTLEEYEAHFDKRYRVRGEITPEYQFHLPKIAEHYPGIKVILVVRNPIDRFVSAARLRQRDWSQWPLPEGGYQVDWQWTDIPRPDVRIVTQMNQEIAVAGRYADTIKECERLGLDLLVLSSEEIESRELDTWMTICNFLGVHFHARLTPSTRHARNSWRDSPIKGEPFTLTEDERGILEDYYVESNRYMRERYGLAWSP
jgi:hypothetical protein